MDKRWVINETGDEETIDLLSKSLGVDEVVANLLVQEIGRASCRERV